MRHLICVFMWLMMALPVVADSAATRAVNDLRTNAGKAAVAYSPVLERAAQAHANDMARRGFFAHQGSNGSAVSDRVSAQGYKWCFVAENIAKGQRDLQQVMQSWTTSKGHYKNMVHRSAREFGLARAKGNIWVMVLASPC
ncbi:MAG: CAP domain-containing protein [Sulfitobacter sp.]